MSGGNRPGDEVVAGRRPALEAVRSGAAVEVLVATGARSTEGLREVVEAARTATVPVHRVPAERVEALAPGERHQGILARVSLPPTLGERELAHRRWAPDALALVLDGVTDPHNVGALARTAEASGASVMVLRTRRGAGLTPGAVRASAGALLHLPVAAVPNIARALRRLKDGGFWVTGLDPRATALVGEAVPPDGRLALVVGSEGPGLSRLVAEACDDLISIPMRGRLASLNVSVAAGVVLFGYAARPSPDRGTGR